MLFCASKIALAALLLLTSILATAQTPQNVKWSDMSKNHNATFYDVKNDFNSKWKGQLKEMAREQFKARRKLTTVPKKKETEAGGYEIYKRWESYMTPRVYPSGNMTLPSTTYQNYTAWAKTRLATSAAEPPATSAAGNWTSLGPVGEPSGGNTGAGRVNFLRFLPGNTNTMFIGTPNGGLWKSTDAGTTWSTNTDFLPIIGCADLAIDPTNTNTMYLATGDLEGDRTSIGVLKSTDGGATWNTTSMAFTVANGYTISKLLMNPSNPLNMLISTNGGVFRTTDGWATWTQTECCDVFNDMEFKPGDPNTVYVAGSTFWKSTNNGASFTQVTTGLPATNVQRIALGVTAGNSAYVYALIGKASDQSFLGMYRSTNSGASFSKRSSSPNLLGYEANGSDATAGQAFYDLSIAVSPTNAELVTTGGVNHWQSADGGTTWTNKTVWDAGNIHADVHEISYLPGSSTTIFSCNDGGIFKSTDNATTWTDISHNLTIAQVVGLGLSANTATTVVDGEQDNGTNLKAGTAWHNIFGGDGGQCFIDYTNNNTIYVQYVEGDFNRSDDGGVNFTSAATGLPAGFDFYSSWHQDPVTSTKLYVAGTPTLYKSANKGVSWTALGTPPGTGTITEFVVAPSNPAIIYAVKQDAISKSTNSGVSFTDITGTLPADAAISNVTVSNTDPNKVWITYSGYVATEKVYKSVNGGTSWTNMSTGLPNLPMNTIIHVNGSANDALYLGADVGIYYFDSTLSSWKAFMTGLPNTTVKQLAIYYPTGKLRAATYGRGIWESDLYGSPSLSTNANLANLKLSSGTLTPTFASATTGYTAFVTNATTSITVTPTASDGNAVIKINGTIVASGSATASIPLAVGNTTLNVVVTATDGVTKKNYAVVVTRPSNNAYLSTLTTSIGTLSPAFTQSNGNYAETVSNATTSITVTPTLNNPHATITVNGTALASGATSAPVALVVGNTTINIVVIAQDGVTKKNYAVVVTRVSNNPYLSNLTISTGTLTPAFAQATASYTASVSNATTSVTVTPTLNNPHGSLTVNGTAVTSGTASAAIPLSVGANTITTYVTAQDGATHKTYTITVTRAVSGMNSLYASAGKQPAPMVISLNEKIEVNNILSPNGDGINDIWVIKNIAFYPGNTVSVYNKAGQVVFTKKGYTNDWGGTSRGSVLDEGTYYYTIDLGYGTPVKGFITVLRNR